jgi:3-oxoacyl-[acyl-carrier protein] reductase
LQFFDSEIPSQTGFLRVAREDNRAVAIVTGSARGIGAACAKALARAGLDVLISYASRSSEADATAAACRSLGVDAVAHKSDVSSDHQCRELAGHAVSRWGRIDVLINNAGTTKFTDADDLEAITAEDFERIFSVNVTGAYQMTRAASTALRESPTGSVVNISSHSGISGIGSSSAYCASKGALNTLTLSLARSLAPDIRVNADLWIPAGWRTNCRAKNLRRSRRKQPESPPWKGW